MGRPKGSKDLKPRKRTAGTTYRVNTDMITMQPKRVYFIPRWAGFMAWFIIGMIVGHYIWF
jgi:hypothetical protein